jgi:hypothetical protein
MITVSKGCKKPSGNDEINTAQELMGVVPIEEIRAPVDMGKKFPLFRGILNHIGGDNGIKP